MFNGNYGRYPGNALAPRYVPGARIPASIYDMPPYNRGGYGRPGPWGPSHPRDNRIFYQDSRTGKQICNYCIELLSRQPYGGLLDNALYPECDICDRYDEQEYYYPGGLWGSRDTRQPTLGGRGLGSLGNLGGGLITLGGASLGSGLGSLGNNISDIYPGRGPTRFCSSAGSMLTSPGGRREIPTRSQTLDPRNTSNVMRRLY